MNLKLSLIDEKCFESYIKNTQKTYTENYLDVDNTMPESFLKTHQSGKDNNGYMTVKKEVYQIFSNEIRVGFTTLTYKRGNCIKTGPTILFE